MNENPGPQSPSIYVSSLNFSESTPKFWDVDDELSKIRRTRLTTGECEAVISNPFYKGESARDHCVEYLVRGSHLIGLEEIRRVLGFDSLENYVDQRETMVPSDRRRVKFGSFFKPSDREIRTADTVWRYYFLKEMRYIEENNLFFSMDSKTVPNLDQLFPSVRGIYRQTFREEMQKFDTIDRGAVEFFLEESTNYDGIFEEFKNSFEDLKV